MLIAQGIIPIPVPPPEEVASVGTRDLSDEENYGPELDDALDDEDEIRYLIAEQERVRREVKELEDLRRLRVCPCNIFDTLSVTTVILSRSEKLVSTRDLKHFSCVVTIEILVATIYEETLWIDVESEVQVIVPDPDQILNPSCSIVQDPEQAMMTITRAGHRLSQARVLVRVIFQAKTRHRPQAYDNLVDLT